jgi:hypothetical protein
LRKWQSAPIASGESPIDECYRQTDAENDCADAVEDGYGSLGGEWMGVSLRQHEVVHDGVDDEAVDYAAGDGVAPQRGDRAGDEDEECGPACGNAEVDGETDCGCLDSTGECGAAEETAGYRLQNANGGGVEAEVPEDDGVEDIECAGDETGEDDGLYEGASCHEALCRSGDTPRLEARWAGRICDGMSEGREERHQAQAEKRCCGQPVVLERCPQRMREHRIDAVEFITGTSHSASSAKRRRRPTTTAPRGGCLARPGRIYLAEGVPNESYHRDATGTR